MAKHSPVVEFMLHRFNPTLSWDGVAMIIACCTSLIWFGTLKETVRQHGETLRHHEELIGSLAEGQKLIGQNIAVLQTIINERTKNGHDSK